MMFTPLQLLFIIIPPVTDVHVMLKRRKFGRQNIAKERLSIIYTRGRQTTARNPFTNCSYRMPCVSAIIFYESALPATSCIVKPLWETLWSNALCCTVCRILGFRYVFRFPLSKTIFYTFSVLNLRNLINQGCGAKKRGVGTPFPHQIKRKHQIARIKWASYFTVDVWLAVRICVSLAHLRDRTQWRF